jgi:hypothetical protein
MSHPSIAPDGVQSPHMPNLDACRYSEGTVDLNDELFHFLSRRLSRLNYANMRRGASTTRHCGDGIL